MACYIISYDLTESNDYNNVYEALRSYKIWARITESTWAIVTNDTAVQVRDRLMAEVTNKDRIFVVRSGKSAAWINPRCKNEWLKKHLIE